VRHAVDAEAGRRVLSAAAAAPGVLGEVDEVLRTNGLDPSRPLSPAESKALYGLAGMTQRPKAGAGGRARTA